MKPLHKFLCSAWLFLILLFVKENYDKNVEFVFANRNYHYQDKTDPISYDCKSWTPIKIDIPKEEQRKKEHGSQDAKEADGETSEHRRKSFAKIYAEDEWGTVAKSGPGSLLSETVNMREILGAGVDKIKEHLGVEKISILDSSCGDMTWMPTFLDGRKDIVYTGFDIVPQNIENHRKNFSEWTFKVHDIVSEPLPVSYDLIISRHTTIHLKNGDVNRAFENFVNSGSRYLLTTTYPNITENEDVGEDNFARFRRLNLMLTPFGLPKPLCIAKDTLHDSDFMGLWDLKLLKKLWIM